MMKTGRAAARQGVIRVLVTAALVLAAAGIVFYLVITYTPELVRVLRSGSVSDVEEYIEQAGNEGRWLLILLQAIETVAIVLPAMPVYICAGAIYGKLEGIAMCYGTNIVMNILIFLAARRLKVTVKEVLDSPKSGKLEELLRRAKRPRWIVFSMCLLPIVPNGLIPYIAAQTGCPARDFLKGLCLGCLPSIVFFVCCGDLLLSEDYQLLIPVAVFLAAALVLAAVFRKPLIAWAEPRLRALGKS